MDTIIVKHSKLDEFNQLCEIAGITPRVIHVDQDKRETEFFLGAGVDVKRVARVLGLK